MTLGKWRGEQGRLQVEELRTEVIERMAEPPWNSTVAKDLNQTARSYTLCYRFQEFINTPVYTWRKSP